MKIPNTISFHTTDNKWVMRITADRRIEVNEDVEVTEAAQKVLNAMQYLLTPQQRTWVGLSDEEFQFICTKFRASHGGWVNMLALEIEAKLKEKNT